MGCAAWVGAGVGIAVVGSFGSLGRIAVEVGVERTK